MRVRESRAGAFSAGSGPSWCRRPAGALFAIGRGGVRAGWQERRKASTGLQRTAATIAGSTGGPASFGGDGQAHLLAGRRHVGNRGAAHVALVALVVEVEAAMHGAAVVPHHQVVDPPAMAVDELAL